MALDTQIRMTWSIVDELGTRATVLTHALADSSVALSAQIAEWSSLALYINALSAGRITGGDFTIVLGPPYTRPPNLNSRVEECAVFNLLNTQTPHRNAVVVPAFNDFYVSAGKVDLSNGDIQAFINILTNASATFRYANPNYQPFSALADAFLSFRRKRKLLGRTSFEAR